MLDATWRWFGGRDREERAPRIGATARTGGDGDDEPILIAVVDGPIAGEMARDALAEEGIPAMVRRNSLGSIYGLSYGSMGASEIWVHPALAERAYDVLVGIGVVEQEEPDTSQETEDSREDSGES